MNVDHTGSRDPKPKPPPTPTSTGTSSPQQRATATAQMMTPPPQTGPLPPSEQNRRKRLSIERKIAELGVGVGKIPNTSIKTQVQGQRATKSIPSSVSSFSSTWSSTNFDSSSEGRGSSSRSSSQSSFSDTDTSAVVENRATGTSPPSCSSMPPFLESTTPLRYPSLPTPPESKRSVSNPSSASPPPPPPPSRTSDSINMVTMKNNERSSGKRAGKEDPDAEYGGTRIKGGSEREKANDGDGDSGIGAAATATATAIATAFTARRRSSRELKEDATATTYTTTTGNLVKKHLTKIFGGLVWKFIWPTCRPFMSVFVNIWRRLKAWIIVFLFISIPILFCAYLVTWALVRIDSNPSPLINWPLTIIGWIAGVQRGSFTRGIHVNVCPALNALSFNTEIGMCVGSKTTIGVYEEESRRQKELDRITADQLADEAMRGFWPVKIKLKSIVERGKELEKDQEKMNAFVDQWAYIETVLYATAPVDVKIGGVEEAEDEESVAVAEEQVSRPSKTRDSKQEGRAGRSVASTRESTSSSNHSILLSHLHTHVLPVLYHESQLLSSVPPSLVLLLSNIRVTTTSTAQHIASLDLRKKGDVDKLVRAYISQIQTIAIHVENLIAITQEIIAVDGRAKESIKVIKRHLFRLGGEVGAEIAMQWFWRRWFPSSTERSDVVWAVVQKGQGIQDITMKHLEKLHWAFQQIQENLRGYEVHLKLLNVNPGHLGVKNHLKVLEMLNNFFASTEEENK